MDRSFELQEAERTDSFCYVSPQTGLLHSLKNKCIDDFEEILKNSIHKKLIDINFVYEDPDNKSLLDIACSSTGNCKFVNSLLKYGADVNQVNKIYKKTPVHFAVEYSDFDTVKVLIENENVDINLADKTGNTALHLAVLRNKFSIVELLLKHRAVQVDKINRKNQSPLLIALEKAINRYYTNVSSENSHLTICSLCEKFANEELKPIAAKLDQECKFPAEQIQKLGSIGAMGILVPEEHGGAGLNTTALSLAVEEISRGCAGTGTIVSIHNALYTNVINKFGTPDQKKHFLPNFVNGNYVGSFALSEPNSGSDAAGMLTTATPVKNGWILNGTKAWVTNAYEAKAIIIFASTDLKKRHYGINAFIIEIPTKGLCIGKKENKLGIRASSTCNVILQNVKVTKDNLLGREGEGFKIAMKSLDCARIGIASQAVGIAQASLDCAVEYANKRIAFGNPIFTLQAVQHRIARMATQIEAARALVRNAASLRDNDRSHVKEASMAKLVASEAATSTSHNCIQILGGMGYVVDMPAERHYRDARITEIYAGPTDIQLHLIAHHVARKYGFLN